MSEARDDNPYAAPQATEEPPRRATEPYREGTFIIAPPQGSLPERCFVCNRAAGHPEVVSATGWVSVYGVVNVSLIGFTCDKHHERLAKVAILRPALMIGLTLLTFTVGIPIGEPILTIALIFGAMVAYTLIVRRLEDWAGGSLSIHAARPREVKLAGAGEAFLQSLPMTPNSNG